MRILLFAAFFSFAIFTYATGEENFLVKCPKGIDGKVVTVPPIPMTPVPSNPPVVCPSTKYAVPSSDVRDFDRLYSPSAYIGSDQYIGATSVWKSPEDVNEWIGKYFVYDNDRASDLAAGQSTRPKPMDPQTLLTKKRGTCVDLATFSHKVLTKIASDVRPFYVRVEYQPCITPAPGCKVFRCHWMAGYEKNGKYFIMGDSTFPGCMHTKAGTDQGFDKFEDFQAFYVLHAPRKVVAIVKTDTTGGADKCPEKPVTPSSYSRCSENPVSPTAGPPVRGNAPVRK